MDKNAITGYLIINAETIDEALKIAGECPNDNQYKSI